MADLTALFDAALAAYGRAYAPYSLFSVGAAILADDGRIYAAANVENAAYPEGICAETAALAAMVLAGGREAVEVVVCGPRLEPVLPCGGCRQRLREFGEPGLIVHAVAEDGRLLATYALADLLPHAFGPGHLTARGST